MRLVTTKTENKITTITLNREQKANAINEQMWTELSEAIRFCDESLDTRVVILNANGRFFSSGMDLSLLESIQNELENNCHGRKRENLFRAIQKYQSVVNLVDNSRKPIIAAVQGGCLGAGLELIAACDFRYCTQDAFFSIKEIDIAMVADLGALQRLPKIMHEGIVREMAYTGRNLSANEAFNSGLVNRVFENCEALNAGVVAVAEDIAKKSPLSVRGTKEILNFSRRHNVEDGLRYVSAWNAAMFFSEDLIEAKRSLQDKTEKSEAKRS